ncbi:MAG: hypothetical protein KKA75_04085, partial [Proteobacteria bacterium]|nr:hypothetical protein [Pseudomonadota bacterium]
DISMGGLAFEYLNISENSDQLSSHKDNVEPLPVSIFLSNNNFHLSEVPCKIIYDINAPLSDKHQEFIISLKHRLCGVKFGSLSENMKEKLEFFLKSHTTELSS